jgi:transmembrane sensor
VSRETLTGVEQDSLLQEAAQWCLELSAGEVSAERVAQWQQWLAASEAHREAFDRIQSTWCAIDRCASGTVPWPTDSEVASDTYDGSVPVSVWRERGQHSPAQLTDQHGSARASALWRRRPWIFVGLAGAIAGFAALAVGPFIRSIQLTPPAVTVIETRSGENRDVPLGDGSIVTAGAESVLWATLTRDSREVTLERGEAFFHVAKDSERPFIVKVGATKVAAVGTAFNVRRAGERVVVAVAEGIVEVDARQLSVGHQLSIDTTRGGASMQIVDAASIAAWREGLLQYRNEPLRAIIADVVRYSTQEIVIADPEVANLRMTTTVFTNDVDSWLQGLEAAVPVRVVRAADGSAHLESR